MNDNCTQTLPDETVDIVCPCFNPPAEIIEHVSLTLGTLRKMFPQTRLHLIVVNDGSTRNFDNEKQKRFLSVIEDSEILNLEHGGKGCAVRGGMAHSKSRLTIYTDIDMPYSLESMAEVINRVMTGTDVVIAIRNHSYYSNLSLMRKMMSYGSKWLNRLCLHTRFCDTQGGLKGFSAKAKKVMLKTTINDFLFDTEFVMLASRDKTMKIEEVQTSLRNGIVMSRMSTKVLMRELKNFFKISYRLWTSH